MRVTALLLQDMIDRHSVVKGPMAFLVTHEDIETLVLIDVRPYLDAIRETKAQPSSQMPNPLNPRMPGLG
jgi:hypothetical protein